MFRLPPCTTHSDTLLPYASLFLSRRLDAKIPEAKGAGRDYVVVAQQGDLVTGEERLRQQLEQAGLQAGQAERQVHQSPRSEEHTSELKSIMRHSYADFCLKKQKKTSRNNITT